MPSSSLDFGVGHVAKFLAQLDTLEPQCLCPSYHRKHPGCMKWALTYLYLRKIENPLGSLVYHRGNFNDDLNEAPFRLIWIGGIKCIGNRNEDRLIINLD